MNKNCQYTKEDIWKYYSNLLSIDEEDEMQEHIMSCDDCTMKLKELRNLAQNIHSNIKIEVEKPEPVEADISLSPEIPIRKFILAAASIAAAIALIIVLIPKDDGVIIPGQNNPGSFHNIDSIKTDSTKIVSDSINKL